MQRTNTSYHSPRIPVAFNWGTNGTVFQKGGGANPFSVTTQDPNTSGPNGGPYPIWYATGRTNIDGIATFAITGGFTPPVTLTAWEWNRAANAWFKIGAAAAEYGHVFDATYGLYSILVSENAYVLITSSAPITGAAYMDCNNDFNSVGAAQEG